MWRSGNTPRSPAAMGSVQGQHRSWYFVKSSDGHPVHLDAVLRIASVPDGIEQRPTAVRSARRYLTACPSGSLQSSAKERNSRCRVGEMATLSERRGDWRWPFAHPRSDAILEGAWSSQLEPRSRSQGAISARPVHPASCQRSIPWGRCGAPRGTVVAAGGASTTSVRLPP